MAGEGLPFVGRLLGIAGTALRWDMLISMIDIISSWRRYVETYWKIPEPEVEGWGKAPALYREDGKWYHHLKKFPGALFDFNGYIVFATRRGVRSVRVPDAW